MTPLRRMPGSGGRSLVRPAPSWRALHGIGIALLALGCGGGCGAGDGERRGPVSEGPVSEGPVSEGTVSEGAGTEGAGTEGAGTEAIESCEGLVGACGGWNGCVHVRSDPALPGHFVGTGANAGASYFREGEGRAGEPRSDVCAPDGSCRLGVRAANGPDCVASQLPFPAPFSCTLTASGCVEAPLPTTAADAPGEAGAHAAAPSCVGLIAACGAWDDCVTVAPDPDRGGHFLGVGANAGHTYVEDTTCLSGTCFEVCSSGSDPTCRSGVRADAPSPPCAASLAPSHAPFTCTMVGDRCVRRRAR